MINNNPYHAPPWPTQRTLYDQALQKTFPVKRIEMLPKHNAVNFFYEHLSTLDKNLKESYGHQNNAKRALAKHMMKNNQEKVLG